MDNGRERRELRNRFMNLTELRRGQECTLTIKDLQVVAMRIAKRARKANDVVEQDISVF